MRNKIGSLLGKTGFGKMSVGEYQANLTGLNTFFGAVLGFVLTGTEALTSLQFGVVLMMLAGAVISILFISSSKHRVVYSIYALVVALVFPDLVDFTLRADGLVPERIRPTLVVWASMAIFVEFWGRERGELPAA